MLSAAIADGRHRPLLEGMIRWAGHALEENENLVRAMIHARAHALLRFTGLDERLANSVIDGLYRMLAELLVDPQHPIRLKVEEGLEKLAHDLVHDPDTRTKVERMKHDILANPAVGEWWMGVWERIRHGLIAMVRDPQGSLSGQLGGSLAELGRALREDQRLQWQLPGRLAGLRSSSLALLLSSMGDADDDYEAHSRGPHWRPRGDWLGRPRHSGKAIKTAFEHPCTN